jgi:hypothetical protein
VGFAGFIRCSYGPNYTRRSYASNWCSLGHFGAILARVEPVITVEKLRLAAIFSILPDLPHFDCESPALTTELRARSSNRADSAGLPCRSALIPATRESALHLSTAGLFQLTCKPLCYKPVRPRRQPSFPGVGRRRRSRKAERCTTKRPVRNGFISRRSGSGFNVSHGRDSGRLSAESPKGWRDGRSAAQSKREDSTRAMPSLVSLYFLPGFPAHPRQEVAVRITDH